MKKLYYKHRLFLKVKKNLFNTKYVSSLIIYYYFF